MNTVPLSSSLSALMVPLCRLIIPKTTERPRPSPLPSFFVLKKGSNVEDVLRGFDLFALAESLGGAASLVEHPGTMSHASMPLDYRQTVGITNELIRLSIGLENADDLIDDLKQALNKA